MISHKFPGDADTPGLQNCISFEHQGYKQCIWEEAQVYVMGVHSQKGRPCFCLLTESSFFLLRQGNAKNIGKGSCSLIL